MLLAVFGTGVVLAMGVVTVAVGDTTEAHAQNGPGGGSITEGPVTMGPAPSKPAIPSAVPRHVQSWKCWDIFVSQC